ncbi:RICIN domain-containing protein [Streptomyces sp. enrichment culture]|uniref:RICIN domain-containing protein n=1 Tax=Streptomyces sp. enrichment culture TaxID=1795815 RepID=UPI003F552216
MTLVEPGTYTIAIDGDLRLTLLGGYPDVRTQIVLLPADDSLTPEKTQQWEVAVLDNGNITLRNAASGTYLGHDGDPNDQEAVFGHPEPTEWQVLAVDDEEGGFHLVVPGGPIDGDELAVDLHPLRIFPPLAGLTPLREGEGSQAWFFTTA